ncbi:MAG: hypothetical protein WCC17_04890 [Candidatus Nitrosopolaris sp.]
MDKSEIKKRLDPNNEENLDSYLRPIIIGTADGVEVTKPYKGT